MAAIPVELLTGIIHLIKGGHGKAANRQALLPRFKPPVIHFNEVVTYGGDMQGMPSGEVSNMKRSPLRGTCL